MTHKMTAKKAALISAFIAIPHIGFADDTHKSIAAPEGHAPISVMGDHMHKAGEVMFSLRQMNMRMEGNIEGTKNVNDAHVLNIANQHGMPAKLRVVPQKMDMKMTMLGAMYAPSDRVTLVAMLMQVENEMTLTTYQGMMGNTVRGQFTSKSSGLGDTVIGALLRGGETENDAWHYGLALSLPTGSITETGEILTPASDMKMTKRLPYPMQLGSGSYDVKPSITYNGDWQKWGGWRVGAQANAVVRLNDNDEDYRLGDKLEVQGWAMKNLTRWASASLHLNVTHQGKIDGQDRDIDLPVQTAQTNFSGGTFANMSLGINLIGQSGALRDHRLALELSMPVHQDANGVQMKRDETLTLGWQKAF